MSATEDEATTMLAAVAHGVATYLHGAADSTVEAINAGRDLADAVGLHAVADMTASPNVAEIAYEIADSIAESWTREDRPATNEERDQMLAAGFALAADVAKIARTIMQEATR